MALFLIIAILAGVITAGTLALPLLRRHEDGEQAEASDLTLYRDQLAEVDRDLARGVVDPSEAERARAEIGRRILAADKASESRTRTAPARLNKVLAGLVVALLVAGGGWTYYVLGVPGYDDLPLARRIAQSEELRATRVSQAEAEEIAAEMPQLPIGAAPEYLDMVEQLRTIAPTRPDDLMAWELLSRNEAALGNYVAAREAQERVIAIKGDDVTVADKIDLVDRMVAATMGFVSPETETVLREVLAEDPANLPARYYMGLLYSQTDRPDIAFRLWRDVVDSGSPDSVHTRFARGQIEEAAFRAGVEYTLPPEGGPTAADIAAASDMTAEDRTAMIEGMVAQLSDRLATEGGTAQDWARLITSLGVLGDTEQAAEIWTEAQALFGGSDEALAVLRQAADQAGVLE